MCAQKTAGDYPIDPNTTDGVTLSEILNRALAADDSQHSGTGPPPGVKPGGLWSRAEANGDFSLMLFDGAQHRAVLRVTVGGQPVTSGEFYNKGQIDTFLQAVTQRLQAVENSILPIGSVFFWDKPLSQLPSNFRLCDGSGGTSYLMNRFIVGAGNSYSLGDRGGSTWLTELPRHDHDLDLTTTDDGRHRHTGYTDYDDGHTHSVPDTTVDSLSGSQGVTQDPGGGTYDRTGKAGRHRHPFTTGYSPTHNHRVAGKSERTGWQLSSENKVDTRPLYHALYPVMRVS